MPQMVLTDYPPQIIWLVIAFILLYFLMTKVALPRVAEILDKRDRTVNDNIKEAEKLKKDAEEAAVKYTKIIDDAQINADNILKETTKQITREIKEKNEVFLEDLKKKERESEKRIEKARGEAMSHVNAVSMQITEQITKVLIGEEGLNKEELKKTVQQSLEKEKNV